MIQRTTLSRFALSGAAIGLIFTAGKSASAGDLIYGLTANDQLVSFESDAPSAILSVAPITGVGANETLLAIDRRPATDELYLLTSGNQLYTLNTTTGAATAVGGPFFADVPLDGVFFGIDFNPTVDRLRVVSHVGQNLRLNPNTGAVVDSDPGTPGVQPDAELFYPSTDVNSTSTPSIVGIAYTNNVAGAATTVLYGIDSDLDILVTIDPPNQGRVNTVGPMGVNTSDIVGFDILNANTAYAALTGPAPDAVPVFFSINLNTGAATEIGGIRPFGSEGSVIDIAVATSAPAVVPLPAAAWMTLSGLALMGVVALRKRMGRKSHA